MSNFTTIRNMTLDHLRDAEKGFTGSGTENPGPKPDQCYASAFATVTGAYAGRGITTKEWAQLHGEIREHQQAFKA